MQVISLFSGIGGFELAAEWAGWENLVSCEINPFGRKVIEYYWPGSYHHDDIHTLNYQKINEEITKRKGEKWRSNDLIIVGGFPCQPYSQAGKRQGKNDSRHLWPEMLRIIREVQPSYVVGENVRGLTNWNGGLVFDEVQADLEAQGYEVLPFLLPACAVGAPHRRDRIWFVAQNPMYNGRRSNEWIFTNNGEVKTTSDPRLLRQEISEIQTTGIEQCDKGDAPNTDNKGLEMGASKRIQNNERRGNGFQSSQFTRNSRGDWKDFPTQSPIRGKYDGVSESMVRNLNPQLYATISKRYTDKDLQEVLKTFQSEEIREQIGGLYKIHDTGILFKVLQLCSPTNTEPKGFSVFSEKASKKIMRKLRKHGTLANTPQGRKLEKQFTGKFADTLPYLSHEIALVAMEAERETISFNIWHRNESIKAYGNAIVPQVAFELFKTINQLLTKNGHNFSA